MAKANTEIDALRAEYEAMSRQEWDSVLTRAHPDFELKTPSEGLDEGVVRGAEKARLAFAEFFGPYESVSVEPEEFFVGDRQTVVFFVQRVRPSGSSGMLERRAAHLWSMRDGQVTRLEIFPRREAALEAAGLSG